jgi:hypothetical protein
MQKRWAQFLLSAFCIASTPFLAAQNQELGRPVAIDKSPSTSLYVLGAQGVVHAVDFLNGRPVITGNFRLPSGWAGSDVVSAQVDGRNVLFLSVNYGLTGQIRMYSPVGNLIRSWALRSGVSGIDYDAASSTLFVASGRSPEIFRISISKDSQPEFVAEVTGSQRLGPILYDARENALLVGDITMGAIYKVDISHPKSFLLFGGLASPQALKLSADGSILFVADAGARDIVTYSIAQPRAAPKIFARIPRFRSPSGLAWAGERLVVSDDGARKLFILSKNGSLEDMLPAER